MNPTVSMVVPCYNKVKYIEAFLKSVYEQKWGKIELVLVNDGSTDGTQDILSEWEPRFIERGFTVIRIDISENQGVAAAVKAGMLRATGDYFCTVDCDDELNPEYVSKMASFLVDNPDYDWVACDFIACYNTENGKKYTRTESQITRAVKKDGYFAERLFFGQFGAKNTVYVYMVRMSYLKSCKIPENFCTHIGGSQETQYYIPLAVGGGELQILPDKLYTYNRYSGQTFSPDSYEAIKRIWQKVVLEAEHTINLLNCPDTSKRRLLFVWRFILLLGTLQNALSLASKEEIKSDADKITELLDNSFSPPPGVTLENIVSGGAEILQSAVCANLFNEMPLKCKRTGKLIACGALGGIGKAYLPKLINTPLEPDVLWDSGARSDSEIYGRKVVRPDYDSLSSDDTVLIFPLIENAVNEIKSECSQRGVTSFLDYYDMLDILSAHYFPQFYGECEFSPGNGDLFLSAD